MVTTANRKEDESLGSWLLALQRDYANQRVPERKVSPLSSKKPAEMAQAVGHSMCADLADL